MGKASVIVYNFQISFFSSANSTFTLSKNRKGILRTIFMLVLANKKIFSKNQTLFRLSWIKKVAKTIS